MINYEELEVNTLTGLLENFAEGKYLNDSGWFKVFGQGLDDNWQGDEIAEALYAKFNGWSD